MVNMITVESIGSGLQSMLLVATLFGPSWKKQKIITHIYLFELNKRKKCYSYVMVYRLIYKMMTWKREKKRRSKKKGRKKESLDYI